MTDPDTVRWQVSEARDALARWDDERGGFPAVYSTERVLADHLRAMLALIDEGMPDGLAAANALRRDAAGQRDARLARLIMDNAWVWERLNYAERRVVEARSVPGESWRQIARRLHMSKDEAAGIWRRLFRRWDVQRVTARVEDGQVAGGGQP